MKRSLLPSAIIVTIVALGLTGCGDKKAEVETPSSANSQPAAPASEAPATKAEAKPRTPIQPVADEQAIFDEKMDVYIKCYNKLQVPVQSSLTRYTDWLKDFKQGSTGEERTVYGIYGVNESNLAGCEKNVKNAVALTPVLQPIDGVTVSYIDAAVTLDNTVNEMDKYYAQEDCKDGALVKGKTLHQTLLKSLETFEAITESHHATIQEANDRRQLAELKNIEEREGKTFRYYSLAVMISAKQINNLISQDKFDAEATMKKVSELGTPVA